MSETKKIRLTINGKEITVEENTTILHAAQQNGIDIPTLCYLEGVVALGGCRLCTVNVTQSGVHALKPACSEQCADGMIVDTESKDVIDFRRFILDLLISDHCCSCFGCFNHGACKTRRISLCTYDQNCFSCGKRDTCKLYEYALRYDLTESSFKTERYPVEMDDSHKAFSYNPNRCIRCRRCQRSCEAEQGESLIGIVGRGRDTIMYLPEDERCESCMKCADSCPTGALQSKLVRVIT